MSEVMEEWFGKSAFFGNRLFAFCMTRSEMVLVTDGKSRVEGTRCGGKVMFVPMVCGRCERTFGGLGECAGKAELDERILRAMPVFRQVEDWHGEEVELVRQVQRGETIARTAADHAVRMQTVVSVKGRLEEAGYLEAGLI